MKHLSKVIGTTMLMLSIFACSNPSDQVTSQQRDKGKITTKYSADRTTATTYLTGTVTLPAGTYDIVDAAVGANVTLANGAKMNQLITHAGTTTVTVPIGASVNVYQTANIESQVTFNNRGNLYGGDFNLSSGAFNNYGSHYPGNLTIKEDGQYKLWFNGILEASGTIKFYREGKMTLTSCNSRVECNHVQVEGFVPYTGFYFVYGKGTFKANTAYITYSSFINDSTIIFCCPSITTSGLGSTGNGTVSCTTPCS